MPVLQAVHWRPISCAASALRHAVRAIASKKAGIRCRTESTHSGTPSTSSPSVAVPDSLDTGRRHQPNRTPHALRPKVATLDPTRLTSDNFLDLSGRVIGTARAYLPSVAEARCGGEHWRFLTKIRSSGMDNRKFPPHARGYLYYYLAHNAPALSGQVRFRVTGINDPALFSSGEDLLRSDHLPWRMPLLSLLLRKYYTAMLHRLVDEGLVSERVLPIASSLPPEAQQANVGSTRVIHAFGQPFLLHFGRARQPFYFVGADTVRQATFEPVAISRGNRGSWLATIRGSALCYFEKSARPEHAGRRVVVCRAVRIIKPMELTGILSIPGSLLPREGELIRTTFPRAQDSPEWSFDVDDNLSLAPDTVRARFAAGLDLLYDNEARAGGPVGW